MSGSAEQAPYRPRRRAPAAGIGTPARFTPVEKDPEYINPLSQLVISSTCPMPGGLNDIDWLEAYDAAHEDENGRLPHEPGYINKHAQAAPPVLHSLAEAEAEARKQGPSPERRTKLTVIELRALYVDHVAGASVYSLGKRLHADGRCSSVASGCTSLRLGWSGLGLTFGRRLDEARDRKRAA